MDLNFEQLQLFIKGMQVSKEAHAEETQSYEFGLNGRLYSHNGKLSFTSIKGTIPIYNNPKIIKYLGYFSFADELVLFVKYDSNYIPPIDTSEQGVISNENFTITIPFGSNQHSFTNELTLNASETIVTVEEVASTVTSNVLIDNYGETTTPKTIDLSELYELGSTNVPNYEICTIGGLNDVPEYNKTYQDAIIVLKKDGYSDVTDVLMWLGNMNWDINRKITTVGIYENSYYKRVYFTDNLNPLRVINLKDVILNSRIGEEFNIKQETTLLQPKIVSINDTGSLPAMNVQYAYRLITDNGQVTHFSPYSEMIMILLEDSGSNFKGGGVKQTTSKSVTIECPIVSLKYKEIQAIAIEYEADTIPTAIRNLGKKGIAEIVEFIHTGNESEFSENLTLEDIIETKNIWTYCNDITTKNNKLIAGGLRNEPYGIQEKYIEDLFLFKGWDISGNTHNSLINPTPNVYKYFDPTNTEESLYIKKQLYTRFLFFGNVTLTFKNKNIANSERSISFENSEDKYVDYIEEIWDWLSSLDLTSFPNLKIERNNNAVLFSPINELTITDFSDYIFESSITQNIIDFQNEYGLLTPTVNTSNLIYGAQSHGFNRGTGVRVSFKEEKEAVLNKSSELYYGGKILDLQTPSLKKTFVKDEIYRMSIQFFKNGNPLFAIVLGDIQVPAIGDVKREITNDIINISTKQYTNQSIEGNTLYAHRIELEVEVRISCELKSFVDSYQIQYVERTESNRTILAQGISSPMTRVCDFAHPSKSIFKRVPTLINTWTLPFNGGPLYSLNGVWAYDVEGENYNSTDSDYGDNWDDTADMKNAIRRREIVNRSLINFDSPDMILGRISDKYISAGKINVVGRLNTDHTGHLIRSRFPDSEQIHEDYKTFGENETHKSLAFSRKIGYTQIGGNLDHKPWTVNVSVFSELTPVKSLHNISSATKLLNKGEAVPGTEVEAAFPILNAALSLFAQHAYNSSLWMSGAYIDSSDQFCSESHDSAQISEGYPTIVLRSETDVFTNTFIGPHITTPIYSSPHSREGLRKLVDTDGSGGVTGVPSTDAHALINIKMNNEASIYGGRNKYAYSQNVFIPLGKVIPLKGAKATNQSQKFRVEGDFYTTLFLRTKNDWSNVTNFFEEEETMHQDNNRGETESIDDFNRGNAWAYGVILETEIESKLANDYRFFRASETIDFNVPINEFINSAYLKKNNLRIYSPVPYNFKDDPLMTNILSASKTKLNADYYDAWTIFFLYEFYELDKDKGVITNITTWKDELYAIQEHETNQVSIDTTDFVTTQSGENVAIKKGDGRTFTTHKKLSDFGTSIRRALAKGQFGFSFFDERKKSFVKFGESLSLKNEIETKLHELFQFDKIIDSEGYYDSFFKETNIRLRTEKGKSYLFSFNELLQVFNGQYDYNHDLYIMFDERVFVPCCNIQKVTILCPVIFSADNLTVQANKYFEYQIQAMENPIAFNAVDLPSGVSVNTNTGLVSGVISVPGVYIIKIIAENIECSDSLEVTVTAVIAKLKGEINNSRAEVNGSISALALIEAVSNGVATVIGTLVAGRIRIYGISNGNGTTSGVLTSIGNLIGISNGVATVTVQYLTSKAPLSGASHGNAIVTGVLNLGATFINGVSNGSSTVEAELIIVAHIVIVDAESDSSSNTQGVLKQPMLFNNYTIDLDVTKDCKLLVYGAFTNYGNAVDGYTTSRYLAVLDTCGNIDTEFAANIGTSFGGHGAYENQGVAVDAEGNIYVGSWFTSFNGVSKNHAVKLFRNGLVDTSFNIGTGFQWFTIAPYVDKETGAIYYGGGYTAYKGVSQKLIVKLDKYGTVDTNFVVGTGFETIVEAILDAGNGQIWVHGYFTTYKGLTARTIVLLNKYTGERDTSFDTGSGFNNTGNSKPLYATPTQDGGIIAISGYNVNTYKGVSISNNIFKLDRNGNLDTVFNANAGSGFVGFVSRIYADGDKYVIAGEQTTYNGIPVPRMLRLNSDGTIDNTFNFNITNEIYYGSIVKLGNYYYLPVWTFAGANVAILRVAMNGEANYVMNTGDCALDVLPCMNNSIASIFSKTTVTGTLIGKIGMSGTSNGSAIITGVLTIIAIMSAIANGVSSTTSDLNIGHSLINGTINALSNTSGQLVNSILYTPDIYLDFGFDDSGSMPITLTRLNEAKDTTLKTLLLPFYNNNLDLYNEKVTIRNFPETGEASSTYERFLYVMAGRGEAKKAGSFISMVFTDEATNKYGTTSFTPSETRAGWYSNDVIALRNRMDLYVGNEYYKGAVFEVKTGYADAAAFTVMLETFFENGGGNYEPPYGLKDRQDKLNVVYNVTYNSTVEYYTDKIRQQLNDFGFNLIVSNLTGGGNGKVTISGILINATP